LETASLQLPKDLIEAAINQQLNVAMAAAFVDKDRVIRDCVTRVLNQKVNEKLEPSSYSYDKPFVEVALGQALRRAVTESLKEQIELYKESIKEQLASELGKKNSPVVKKLAAAMVDGFTKAATESFRLTIAVE